MGYAFQDWLDRNAHRAFPLKENSNRACRGDKVLPNGLLLDARVCLFGQLEPPVRLARAIVAGDTVTVVFSIGGREFQVVSSGGFGVMSDENRGVSIRVWIGREAMESGEYELIEPAEVISSRVMFVRHGIGVDTLTVAKSGAPVVSGWVEVEDGHNTTLTVANGRLSLNAQRGLGKGVICNPEDYAQFLCDNVVFYINGQQPDSDGNFEIMAGAGVTVSTGKYISADGQTEVPAVIIATADSVNNFAGIGGT